MRFESYGIHTRLHYLIKRIDGIDYELRKKYLKERYHFDDEIIDLIYKYVNVEEFLDEKKYSIEEIKELINKQKLEEDKKKQLLSNLFSFLNIKSPF